MTTAAPGLVYGCNELDDRRALYAYARQRGFPPATLRLHQIDVLPTEAAWRDFAQTAPQYALWEAALVIEEIQ